MNLVGKKVPVNSYSVLVKGSLRLKEYRSTLLLIILNTIAVKMLHINIIFTHLCNVLDLNEVTYENIA